MPQGKSKQLRHSSPFPILPGKLSRVQKPVRFGWFQRKKELVKGDRTSGEKDLGK